MGRRKTRAEVLQDFKSLGFDYDYSKFEYKNTRHRSTIVCPRHGEFKHAYASHMLGSSCPKCKLKTQSEAISDLESLGNSYDYSNFVYTGSTGKSKIECPTHGVFEQSFSNHMRGQQCPKCSGKHKYTTQEAVDEMVALGLEYDYSKFQYKNSCTPSIIFCPKHGEFLRTFREHTSGLGCQRCGERPRRTQQDALDVLESLDRGYDYSQFEYKKCGDRSTIICKEHGKFQQSFDKHVHRSASCPQCLDKGHLENHQRQLELINTDLVCEFEKTGLVPGRKFRPDLYFPEKRLAIDFHGAHWHDEQHRGNNLTREKVKAFREEGINMLTFFWAQTFHNQGYLNLIRHKLGETQQRVYGRKTKVVTGDFRDFFGEHHLLGVPNAKNCLGLTYEGRLVAAICVQRWNGGVWNLTRFVNKSGTQVIGGFSKLLKAFKRDHQGTIITFSDNLISDGHLYESTGFVKDRELSPDYWYNRGGEELLNKREFRHAKLAKRDGFVYDPDLTEHQNCINNNYYRVYDAGKIRWVLE